MKSKIITVSGVLIAMNLIMGLLLSSYSTFNLVFTTVILLVSTALVYMANTARVGDAIKVSFTILFILSCFVKYVLALIAPEHLQDNWCLIVCIVITVFEVLMLVVYHKKQA